MGRTKGSRNRKTPAQVMAVVDKAVAASDPIEVTASSLARLAQCPASGRMEKALPRLPSGPEAERGIAFHKQMADAVNGGAWLRYPATAAVSKWLDAISVAWESIRAEVEVDCAPLGFARHGYIDLLGVDLIQGMAAIVDWKTGRQTQYPEKNWQLLAYAMLVAEKYDLAAVHLALVDCSDPDNPRILSAKVSRGDLQQLRYTLTDILAAARQPNPPIAVGGHCAYCRAREVCPERLKLIPEGKLIIPDEFNTQMIKMTPDARGEYYRRILLAEKLIENLKAAFKAFALDGLELTGFTLKSRIMKNWDDETAAAAELAPFAEALYETALLGPTAALKAAKKAGLADAVNIIQRRTVDKPTAPTLVEVK